MNTRVFGAMAECLVPDLSAVLVVLQHLSEFESCLSAERIPFQTEASHHLRQIAEAVQELEASRKATHEELEVETIETSKLRHQVVCQRDHIINEISAGVAAARDVSVTQLNLLQLEMKRLSQETESVEEKRKAVEEEITVLLPEQEFMRSKYDDVVDQLNIQLSEKANMQINLNQLMNEIQTVEQKIPRVQKLRTKLLEEKRHEQESFQHSNKTLDSQIEEIMSCIQEQKEANMNLQQMLDVVSAKLLQKDEQVHKQSEKISRLERSISGLQESEVKYTENLEQGITKSDTLDSEKKRHDKELEDARESIEQKIQTVLEKTAKMEKETEEGRKLTSVHLERVREVKERFSVERRKEDEALTEQRALSRHLEKSKQRLEERVASVAKFKFEVKGMKREIKELQENNIINAELFQKGLDGLEGQLAKEKESRAALDLERDELCSSLEGLKEHHENSMRKLGSAIDEMMKRFNKLQEEEQKLRDHTPLNSLIEQLTNSIVSAEEEQKQMEISYNTQVQQLASETESMRAAGLEKEEALKLQQAELEECEAQFGFQHSRHLTLTEQTHELQSRKNQLELSIEEMKTQTAALLKPKEKMKTELQVLRDKHLKSLSSRAEQISCMEKSIYKKLVILEQVKLENSRLHLMKEDISAAKKDQEKLTQDACWMSEEVQVLYWSLMEAWLQDTQATGESTQRDEKLLEALNTLLVKIQERKQCVGEINCKLEQKLEAISALTDQPAMKTNKR